MASDSGTHANAPTFGVSAEFTSAAALLASVRRLRPEHHGHLEAYSPVPVPGLSAALGARGSLVPMAVGGAIVGFAAMMGLCIYGSAYDYVFDIGGRPLVSWPAFVVPSVSFATLVGALATYLAMLFTNRLPRLNHPAFNIPGFTRASQDRFFLTIAPDHKALDFAAIQGALNGLTERPVAVAKVPR